MIFQNKKFSILFIFMVMFLFNSSRLDAVILHSEKIKKYEGNRGNKKWKIKSDYR